MDLQLYPSDDANMLIYQETIGFIRQKYLDPARLKFALNVIGLDGLESLNGELIENLPMRHNEFIRQQLTEMYVDAALLNIPNFYEKTHLSMDVAYDINSNIRAFIQDRFQVINFEQYHYGFCNSDVYEYLLEDSKTDPNAQVLTPENFEQRTRLHMDTYPELIKIFRSLDHSSISDVKPKLDVNGKMLEDIIHDALNGEYVSPKLMTKTWLEYTKPFAYTKKTLTGYALRYTKSDLAKALNNLGFATFNDSDLRKITLADIKPNDQLSQDDALIPLAGFYANKKHKMDYTRWGSVIANAGESTSYLNSGLTSCQIYYETIYRSLART
jgi:hypothetical protein